MSEEPLDLSVKSRNLSPKTKVGLQNSDPNDPRGASLENTVHGGYSNVNISLSISPHSTAVPPFLTGGGTFSAESTLEPSPFSMPAPPPIRMPAPFPNRMPALLSFRKPVPPRTRTTASPRKRTTASPRKRTTASPRKRTAASPRKRTAASPIRTTALPPICIPALPPNLMPAPPISIPAFPPISIPAFPPISIPAFPPIGMPALPPIRTPAAPLVYVPAPPAGFHPAFPHQQTIPLPVQQLDFSMTGQPASSQQADVNLSLSAQAPTVSRDDGTKDLPRQERQLDPSLRFAPLRPLRYPTLSSALSTNLETGASLSQPPAAASVHSLDRTYTLADRPGPVSPAAKNLNRKRSALADDTASANNAKVTLTDDTACASNAKVTLTDDTACASNAKVTLTDDTACSSNVKVTLSDGASCSNESSSICTSSPAIEEDPASRREERSVPTPGTSKDAAYWERRRKNNESAKRSRDSRREEAEETIRRLPFLEQTNIQLRLEKAYLLNEIRKLELLVYGVSFPRNDDNPTNAGLESVR